MKRKMVVTPEMRQLAKDLGMLAEPDLSITKCEHTPRPEAYLQWHSWAARMSKTHKQKRCPNCGLWAVWVPKEKRK